MPDKTQETVPVTVNLPADLAERLTKEGLDAACLEAFELTLDEVVAELCRDALSASTR